MTNRPQTERPTMILSLFRPKKPNAKFRKPRLGHDAGDLRYLARLQQISGHAAPSDIVRYLDRDDAVAAFECFSLRDLASMAGELESNAREASSKVAPPWFHGHVSLKIFQDDFESGQVIIVEGVHK